MSVEDSNQMPDCSWKLSKEAICDTFLRSLHWPSIKKNSNKFLRHILILNLRGICHLKIHTLFVQIFWGFLIYNFYPFCLILTSQSIDWVSRCYPKMRSAQIRALWHQYNVRQFLIISLPTFHKILSPAYNIKDVTNT